MKRERQSIGLVTFPLSKPGNIPLSHLVEILGDLSSHLYVVTGNEADIPPEENRHIYRIDHKEGRTTFFRITKFIFTQLRISYRLARLTGKVNRWVLFIGGEGLLLPVVTANRMVPAVPRRGVRNI